MANDTQGSADIQARRAGEPVITTSYLQDIASQRDDINSMVGYMSSNETFKRFWNYPQFIYNFAEHLVKFGTEPPAYLQWEWGQRFKMPPNLLSTGGGGGGGANRANTIRSFETAILNRSSALGLTLDPQTISYIATVAEAQDYSSEQLMQAIVGLVDFKKVEAGTLTASLDSMKATANSYLVSVSDETLQDYAKKLATGAATAEGIESFFKAQAKAMNPWLSEYIDAGIAPEELLKPSRDTIARSLGISAAEVDFTDDRFIKLATIEDDKGNIRMANNRELVKNIRNDSAWAGTTEARAAATGLASAISRIFGRSVF